MSQFQSFEDEASSAESAARVKVLRESLKALNLDGFLIPRADAHQNEYVPASEERLAWLTGFTGSAGFAIVLREKAAIFVDGRYTVQVRNQIDEAVFTPQDSAFTRPSAWLEEHAGTGARIGFDPWLHTPSEVTRFEAACAAAGAELVGLDANPIDNLWQNRPAAPCAPVVLHPEQHAGETASAKLARIQAELTRAHADALVLADPHAIAWAFNIRGGDVAHTPLPLAFAMMHRETRPALFIDGRKLDNEVRNALEQLADLREPGTFAEALQALGAAKKTVWLDPATTAQRIAALLEAAGARLHRAPDPIGLMKAVKNEAEITGARAAHLRDGWAMCRFLAWLDRSSLDSALTEIDVAEALENFRRETGALKDLSFPSISAAGPNAALPHYRVTRATNHALNPGLFLIDSGAQYLDGTTDITRTVVIGEATPEMRDRFTRVLQGHIAVATAVFPKGTTGAALDPFARRPLWEIGTDFDHGTGHGVGSYLSVHEGPQRISRLGHVPLEAGMILSNEPGYYREGHYGIRLENLVLVQAAEISGAERPMLGFETLTLAPFDTRAVLVEKLSASERAWLNAYHARVYAALAPHLDEGTRGWLERACRTI